MLGVGAVDPFIKKFLIGLGVVLAALAIVIILVTLNQ
jgi:hypothetical protein